TDRLIITLNPSSATGAQIASSPALAADALSDEAGADLSYVRPFGAEAHVLSLDAPRPYAEVEAIAQRLAATPEVLAARPDAILLPSSEPTDPGYSAFTWHLWPVAAGNYGANLPPAWEITTGAPSIVTAVIDTGGLLGHEDLAGRTRPGNPGYDMISSASAANDGDERDPNPSDPGDYVTAAEARPGCGSRNSSWHGSHVGGTIGARANNGKGTAGINWGSPLLFVRALGKCGGYLSDIADGMRWAAGLPVAGLPTNPNPARVLNLSLGAPSNTCDSFFQDAISAVTAAGAVVVVAAGNENTSAADAQPGNCAGVITVAATARNGDRAWYSNYGAAVEIAAPGGDTSVDSAIYSTIDSGARGPEADAYGRYQGTSMATPHVAGIVSLMLSANPALTPSQVLQILQSTAAPFPAGSDCIGACGAGLIDAGAAVEEAARLVRTASFRSSSTAASEGGPAVSLPITLSIASNQTVSVPFTVAGSAGASDHTLAAGSVSFAPGDTSADLSFSITEDDLVEGGETIVVSLGSSTRAGRGALSTHTITIEDNDAAAAIVLTPASLSLGEQQVGSSGATRVITISNPGVLPLTIGNLAITGDFGRQGGSCPSSYPSTIAVGASCTVNVRFAPTRLGRRAGGLLVTSDVAGGPHAVPLSG
ncbi:MAG: S8 family serine peptidase, partial [Chloroflexales bacterium]|nr:S8 family serine peptidase [Chloroflexales bacterium]